MRQCGCLPQVRGWIFFQGALVQVAAGFCTCDGKTGAFQIRGSMRSDADVPEDGTERACAEIRGTQSLASTAGTMADLENNVEAVRTDSKVALSGVAHL